MQRYTTDVATDNRPLIWELTIDQWRNDRSDFSDSVTSPNKVVRAAGALTPIISMTYNYFQGISALIESMTYERL